MFSQLGNRLYVKGTYINLHKSDVLNLFTLSVVVFIFVTENNSIAFKPRPPPRPFPVPFFHFNFLLLMYSNTCPCLKTNCRIIEQFVTITFGPYLHTHYTNIHFLTNILVHIRAYSQGNFSIQYTYIKKRIFFYYVNYNFNLFL